MSKKEIIPDDLSSISDDGILSAHLKTHQLFGEAINEDNDELLNKVCFAHEDVYYEMESRGLEMDNDPICKKTYEIAEGGADRGEELMKQITVLGSFISGKLSRMNRSIGDMARETDLSELQVKMILNGKLERPSDSVLNQIANFLNVSFEEVKSKLQSPEDLENPTNRFGWNSLETIEAASQQSGGKFTKNETRYLKKTDNASESCSSCTFFLRDEETNTGSCQVVAEEINELGRCSMWISAAEEAKAELNQEGRLKSEHGEDDDEDEEDDMEDKNKLLDEARTPEFDDTEPGEVPEEWPPDLEDFIRANDWDADVWDDLTEDQKQRVVETTLLGEVADTFEESMMFNAVDVNGRLRENALVSVLGGRGAQADITESQRESARDKARQLLNDEFGRDLEKQAKSEECQVFLSVGKSESYYELYVDNDIKKNMDKDSDRFTLSKKPVSDHDIEDGSVIKCSLNEAIFNYETKELSLWNPKIIEKKVENVEPNTASQIIRLSNYRSCLSRVDSAGEFILRSKLEDGKSIEEDFNDGIITEDDLERFYSKVSSQPEDGDYNINLKWITSTDDEGGEKVEKEIEEVTKVDDERQIVDAIVAESNVVDAHGEKIPPEEIINASIEYMKKSQLVGKQHREKANASLVGSIHTPQDVSQWNGKKFSTPAWIVQIQVHKNSIWRKIKSGEITGVSLGGFANVRDLFE